MSQFKSPLVSCLTCRKEYSAKGIFTHFIVSHTEEGKLQKLKASAESLKKATRNFREKCKNVRSEKIEEYNKNPLTCKCGSIIQFDKKNNMYCSKSCSATYTKKKPRSKESKLKTSLIMKEVYFKLPVACKYPPKPKLCEICGINHIRNGLTCSHKCQIIRQSIQQSLRLSNPEYRRIHNYGRGKKSWLESSFSDWLISKNILNFKTEEKFHNPQLNKFYFVDFLFEKKKLIIELDGSQHRKTVIQDKIRDEFLTSLGYTVIRITHTEYQKKSRISEIENLLE